MRLVPPLSLRRRTPAAARRPQDPQAHLPSFGPQPPRNSGGGAPSHHSHQLRRPTLFAPIRGRSRRVGGARPAEKSSGLRDSRRILVFPRSDTVGFAAADAVAGAGAQRLAPLFILGHCAAGRTYAAGQAAQRPQVLRRGGGPATHLSKLGPPPQAQPHSPQAQPVAHTRSAAPLHLPEQRRSVRCGAAATGPSGPCNPASSGPRPPRHRAHPPRSSGGGAPPTIPTSSAAQKATQPAPTRPHPQGAGRAQGAASALCKGHSALALHP